MYLIVLGEVIENEQESLISLSQRPQMTMSFIGCMLQEISQGIGANTHIDMIDNSLDMMWDFQSKKEK